MNGKKRKGIILTFVSLLLLCFLLVCCIFFKYCKEPYLKELSIESNDNVAFMLYDSIHVNDQVIKLDKLLEKYNKEIFLEETLCVYDNGIYLLCQNQNSDRLLVRVDAQTEKVRELCVLKYSDKQQEFREVFPSLPFDARTAYYDQGKIVIHNNETVFLFDLKTETIEQVEFQEFQPTKQSVYGEILDAETIQIGTPEKTKKISLKDISQSSKSFAAIYAKKDKRTWSKDVTRFGYFLQEHALQVVDDTVFIVGQYRNFNGSVIAVLLQYDYNSDEWKYINSLFTGDIIVTDLYMVPYVKR